MPSIDCNNLLPVMDHSTPIPMDKKPEDGTESSIALLHGCKSTLESPRSQSTAETFTDQSSLCSNEDDQYYNSNGGGDNDANTDDESATTQPEVVVVSKQATLDDDRTKVFTKEELELGLDEMERLVEDYFGTGASMLDPAEQRKRELRFSLRNVPIEDHHFFY